jgi:ribosomal protein L37E
MGLEDRNWWQDKQNEEERKKLSNSSLWCSKCGGLNVNALTLICSSCGFDNSKNHRNRNPIDGHPFACTCVECTKKRLEKWGLDDKN